jgi:hypothetical protein
MTIWVPLVLLVMPMSIGIGTVMFVIAAMSTVSFAGIYITRPHPLRGLSRSTQAKRRHASDDYARRWRTINSLSRRIGVLKRRPQILPRMRGGGAATGTLAMIRAIPTDAVI